MRYTGRIIQCTVTYLLKDFGGIRHGWAVMALSGLKEET